MTGFRFVMFRKCVFMCEKFKKTTCTLNRCVPAAVIPLRRPARVIYCENGELVSQLNGSRVDLKSKDLSVFGVCALCC